MKRILLLAISLVTLLSYTSAISIVNGTWNRGNTKKVSLYSIEKGVLKEIASSAINVKKEFAFAFTPDKEGFYVIGESDNKSLGPANKYTFYFNPNDNLNIAVNDNNYTLVGENTVENIEMKRWHDLVQSLELKGIYFMKIKASTYVDFFPELEEKLPLIDAYESKTKNEIFNNAFADYRKFDLLNDALYLLSTPRAAHPQGEDMPDYYRENAKLENITKTDAILNYPYGMGLIRMTQTYAVTRGYVGEKKRYSDPIEMLRDVFPSIIDEKVKSEFVLSQYSYFKSYEGAKAFDDEFGKYIIEGDKKEVKDLLYTLASNSIGQDAFDFKFKDVNNKDVALSDFKGKVVYVDIWATWCSPCKKELPSLHKLEAEYKDNKDLIFMGVSIDVSKDHEKWKQFLVREEMSGIQVFAGDKAEKEILDPYKIKGIPHFLLIDKNGKVVSPNAPRPSSSEIRALLNATLNK